MPLSQGQFIYYVHWQTLKTGCFLTKIGEKERMSIAILIQHNTRSISQCNKAGKEIKKEKINWPYLQMT